MIKLQNKHLVMTGVIVTTVAMITALNIFKPTVDRSRQKTEPVLQINAIEVRPQNFTVALPSQGIVRAKSESTLAAQISGNVVEVSERFRQGGVFTEGDWLLTIDPRNYKASLKLAVANERKATLELQQEKARADQALRDWNRLSPNESAPALVLRKPQLAAAEAELASAQAQLSKAELDLERTRITAPYDGRIMEQLVDLGHFVNGGTQLAEIASSKNLEVALPISAQWRPFIDLTHSGYDVDIVSTLNQGEQHWPGKIVRTSGAIDKQSRQLLLIAEISPLDKPSKWPLLIGDYVSAAIDGKTLEQVFVLPLPALIDGEFMWRVEEGRVTKVEVGVLWQGEDLVVVDSGLSQGDIINITPVAYLLSGTRVDVINKPSGVIVKSSLSGVKSS